MIDGIHAKVYEAASGENALNMGRWHVCGTTHCRAGWVVHLAGEPGYALERRFDTPTAASMIYRASSPLKVARPRFWDTEDAALADMRLMAEREAALASGSTEGA